MRTLITLLLLRAAASSLSSEQYNLSPRNRALSPTGILRSAGIAHSSSGLFPLKLSGEGAFVVLDFGKEVGGHTSVHFGAVDPSGGAEIGVTYSESTNYASCPSSSRNSACQGNAHQSGSGDSSNGGDGPDSYLRASGIKSNSVYRPAPAQLRGGFRYMNLFLVAGGTVEITAATLWFTPSPTMRDPSAYKNHFLCSDHLVNRIWYASAYTVQLCSIDPHSGRTWPAPKRGWDNGIQVGLGATLLTDGAKRDRTVWPGDLGVGVAAAVATLGDVESSRNAIDTLFSYQSPSGMLPYVGPPVLCDSVSAGLPCQSAPRYSSDTYHLWTLFSTGLLHGHMATVARRTWIHGLWEQYKRAVQHSLSKMVSNGLFAIDATADFQRREPDGACQLAPNALLAKVLEQSVLLAQELGDRQWEHKAQQAHADLKAAVNQLLWDDSRGAFRDSMQPPPGISTLCFVGLLGLMGLFLVWRWQRILIFCAGKGPRAVQAGRVVLVLALSTMVSVACFKLLPSLRVRDDLLPQDGNSLMLWFLLTTPARAARVSEYLESNWSPHGAITPEWKENGRGMIHTFSGSMEVLGQAASGHPTRALDLIRREWGYMLLATNSTQSTFWEGYQADGQYAFEGTYMSHAHVWAAGPAAALSFYVLGLREDRLKGGNHFMVAPQFGGLLWCEGSLELGDGKVHARWEMMRWSAQKAGYTVHVDTRGYLDAVGSVGLPVSANAHVAVREDTKNQPIKSVVRRTLNRRKLADGLLREWYELPGGMQAWFTVVNDHQT